MHKLAFVGKFCARLFKYHNCVNSITGIFKVLIYNRTWEHYLMQGPEAGQSEHHSSPGPGAKTGLLSSLAGTIPEPGVWTIITCRCQLQQDMRTPPCRARGRTEWTPLLGQVQNVTNITGRC